MCSLCSNPTVRLLTACFADIGRDPIERKGATVGSKTLRDVAVGECATVARLTGDGAIKRRIMDMGLTKGTEVCVRKVAPLGDPIEVTVRGFELSLRKDEAVNVLVN